MSKSNSKKPDRLRSSKVREQRREYRHTIKQLMREHRFDELEKIDELPYGSEEGYESVSE